MIKTLGKQRKHYLFLARKKFKNQENIKRKLEAGNILQKREVFGQNQSLTNAAHSSGQRRQNARIPHILGTQRAANMVIKPRMSRGEGVRGLL